MIREPYPVSNNLAFLLITPDAVVRHLASPILKRVRLARLRVLAHRVLATAPADLRQFHYRHPSVAADQTLYDLASRLFGSGPLVAVLLTTSDGAGDASGMLAQVKGAGNPNVAEPGTLRRDFRAINTILNLVHSSDDTANALAESQLFDVPLPACSDGDRNLDAQVDALCRTIPREWREYDDVVAELRSRLVERLGDELGGASRQLCRELRREGPEALAAPGVGSQLATGLPTRHPLRQLLALDYTPDSDQTWPQVERWLRVAGVVLDEWAELVLTSSLRFQPLRRVTAARSAPLVP
jgi:nucleoside diphosphate kinase